MRSINDAARAILEAGPNWRERTVARSWRTLAAWLPRSLVYFAAVRALN